MNLFHIQIEVGSVVMRNELFGLGEFCPQRLSNRSFQVLGAGAMSRRSLLATHLGIMAICLSVIENKLFEGTDRFGVFRP